MTNNDILKKLRVALQLRDDEIVDILALVDFRISKSEIGAFCRKEGHPKYRECGDQVLRNFLNGLVIHLRGPKSAAAPTPKKKEGTQSASKPRKAKYTGLGSVPYKNKKGPGKTQDL
jgi:energy-coupling factor transporter ATP-binding protein EcfA2